MLFNHSFRLVLQRDQKNYVEEKNFIEILWL